MGLDLNIGSVLSKLTQAVKNSPLGALTLLSPVALIFAAAKAMSGDEAAKRQKEVSPELQTALTREPTDNWVTKPADTQSTSAKGETFPDDTVSASAKGSSLQENIKRAMAPEAAAP